MNTKGRISIRIVAGLYLAYLGYKIIRDVLQDRPENYILFVIAGIVFLAAGAAIAFLSYKDMKKLNEESQQMDIYSYEGEDNNVEEAASEETVEEAAVIEEAVVADADVKESDVEE